MEIPIMPHDETLASLDDYRYWWNPRSAPPWRPPVFRALPPHCGAWYDQPASVPTTARWALVHQAFPPGRVLYTKSYEAAVSMFERLPFADHPHVRIVCVRWE